MSFIYLFILAVALSMDAFTVAICKGLSMKKITVTKTTIIGMYFGFFQAAMPLLGYLIGKKFEKYIVSVDHWIAFFLLAAIGVNMIKEALSQEEREEDGSLKFMSMLILSIATSIDAMAVGIAFAFLDVNIFVAVLLIGITTFIISMIGVKIGNFIGAKFKKVAEVCGGMTLIGLGLKILLEGLEVL